MLLPHIPALCLAALLFLQVSMSHPVPGDVLSSDEANALQALLLRLEESLSQESPRAPAAASSQREAPVAVEEGGLTEEAEADEGYSREEAAQPRLSLAAVREFLSARDLKAVRNDSSKRYSGCFGRRMDRIGSMTSLGCNTVGRNNSRRR